MILRGAMPPGCTDDIGAIPDFRIRTSNKDPFPPFALPGEKHA